MSDSISSCAPFGDSVYMIEANATNSTLVVRQQFVRTGRIHGDFISVESGLKAGDRVVSAGIFKLRNGMNVQENNQIIPKPAATSRPSGSAPTSSRPSSRAAVANPLTRASRLLPRRLPSSARTGRWGWAAASC